MAKRETSQQAQSKSAPASLADSKISNKPEQPTAANLLKNLRVVGKGPAIVSVVMGSRSDWETMQHASRTLATLGITHEIGVVSAHRTPDLLVAFANAAEARGVEVVIAGAGGAAHLPGMIASMTIVPVLGVPVQSEALRGMDSLLSIVQMPGGVPVGTLAIGKAGAINAGLLAAAIVSASRPELRETLRAHRAGITRAVLDDDTPLE